MRVAGEAQNIPEVLALARAGVGRHRARHYHARRERPRRAAGAQGGAPRLPVLILSMHPEDQFALRALKTGAAGYRQGDGPRRARQSDPESDRGAQIRQPGPRREARQRDRASPEKSPQEPLSDREYQVLRLIASGHKVGAIAESLGLSVKTVSTYRARILAKMRMKSNAELTHYAIQIS